MRLLHFADLHLDAPFTWAPPQVARARRAALRATLERICELASDLEVDALTCGGDLYEHDRFTPDTMQFVRSTFADLTPVPVFIAPGNHDWHGPTSLYAQAGWSSNVHIFEENELTPHELEPGLFLWGAAHHAPANTDNFLEDFQVDRSGVHIALFHGSETGDLFAQGEGKRPHAPFRAEQIRQAGLQHALLGHFHTPKDAEVHTYPGNPDPLTFGETGDRAAVLLTVDDAGGVTRERHSVATSLVQDVPVTVTGATDSTDIGRRVANAVAGLAGTVRVILSGNLKPEIDLRLRDLEAGSYPGIDSLVVHADRIGVDYDFEKLANEPTVRGQFVRDVLDAKHLEEEQRRRVLVTGLRALDGRHDELDVH